MGFDISRKADGGKNGVHNAHDHPGTYPNPHRKTMNKAFVKENDAEEETVPSEFRLPAGVKNYITSTGYQKLKTELLGLIDVERPEVVRIVSWAASNGDRSENGDYLYGKKRLREIDRRIRFLTKRLELAEIVDPSRHNGSDQVFFGATVTYVTLTGEEQTVKIVGIDEAEPLAGKISWIAPIARALLKASVGDVVTLATPGGMEKLEILEVNYA